MKKVSAKNKTGKRFKIGVGDCLDVIAKLPDNSVDSIVTDPPYGLSDHSPKDVTNCLNAWLAGKPYVTNKKGFMGKTWDSWVPGPEVWKECYRVLKPGGHVIAFAGSRTHDLMSIALRLAGFEFRDTVIWTYGSGFPKSHNIGMAIDKMLGGEREVIGVSDKSGSKRNCMNGDFTGGNYEYTAPATKEAKQWNGYGSALKPAFEPALMFRKPLDGTLAENVLKWGVGGLNIDGCRVATEDKLSGGHASGGQQMTGGWERPWMKDPEAVAANAERSRQSVAKAEELGRWPANLIHDGSDEVVSAFPHQKLGANKPYISTKDPAESTVVNFRQGIKSGLRNYTAESSEGNASRFFYTAKASKRDRDEGLEGFSTRQGDFTTCGLNDPKLREARGRDASETTRANIHPTVKPTDLMRYLCRLVTPPNGIVLDLFMGSGSTGKAAMLEGFRFIGFELSPEYAKIARARIQYALDNRAFLLSKGKSKSGTKPAKPIVTPSQTKPVTRGLFENTPKRKRK